MRREIGVLNLITLEWREDWKKSGFEPQSFFFQLSIFIPTPMLCDNRHGFNLHVLTLHKRAA